MANLNEMDKWQIAQEAMKKLNALPKVPGGVDPTAIAKPVADYLPFRFENPLPAMQKSYNEAGGGVAGVGALLGNRLKAGVEGAVDMARPDTEPGLISGFKQGFGTATTPVANTRPVETQTSVGLPIGGGITVTGDNTSGRAGFSPRTYRDASGNVVASGVSSVVGRGGFVGATTDAEAARNLQSRFEQDKAASQIAANFDRQTEALRNARAEKLGISREVLDASEGRGVVKGTPVETAPNPFSMPGDNFGDDIRRRNELLSTINDPNARKADRAAALSTFQSFMSQPQPQPVRMQPQSQGNPLDVNKFLLDQQKFAWQQGVDRNKVAIDELEAQSKVAGAKLQQQKYNDAQRKAFMDEFSYPAEGAPQAQLGELAWNLSKSTGGQLSPQEATLYIQKVADKNGIDWKDVQPESLVALGQEAMKLAKQDRMQK